MLLDKTNQSVFEPHRYQVEARQARLLAEARRDRVRPGRLARAVGARLTVFGSPLRHG